MKAWHLLSAVLFMFMKIFIGIKYKNDTMENYQETFSKYIKLMNESLKHNNFSGYEMVKEMLDETVEECKEQKALCEQLNTSNFGILNHLFEEALPTLLKKNKKAVRNVIKTIKEDKNLSSEFNFYNSLKTQFNNEQWNIMGDSLKTLDYIAEETKKNINKSTLLESNKKLRKVMKENNVIPLSMVNEEDMSLYKNGNVILSLEKKPSNLAKLSESYEKVADYMGKHSKSNVNETKNPMSLISDYEKNLKANLTESELSLVQQITDFKTPIAETRKQKLFNKFKNECIDKINDMIKEENDNGDLKALKEQLESQQFNNETIVKDIAKLLEIRDILMDK
jgi:hypothetical protein